MGYEIRRSISLRSHRTHGSGDSGSSLQYVGNRSSGNLAPSMLPSLTSPGETPEDLDFTAAVLLHNPPPAPAARPRNKLTISARSISNRFRPTDTLSSLSSAERDSPNPHLPAVSPPIPNLPSGNESKTSLGMLAAPAAPKRPPPERPVTSGSHQPFPRDFTSLYPIPNGAPLPLQQSNSTTSIPTIAGHNPTTIYQNIHETSAKRIATIEYMRKVHDGNVFYFNTVHYTSATLSSMPSLAHHKLGRRATNYIVLGYSLPALLDLNSGSALEYLKALLGLLQEFELYQSLSGFDSSGSSLGRGRVGQMFKSGMGLGGRSSRGRRSSTATEAMFAEPTKTSILGLPLSSGSNESISPMEGPSPVNPSGHDFTYLLTPYLCFEPDFGVTFATLCDTLIDTYVRLLDLVSAPEVCGTGVGDTFVKADKLIRKILVANVMREFDDTTRAQAKSELAGLGRLVLGGLM